MSASVISRVLLKVLAVFFSLCKCNAFMSDRGRMQRSSILRSAQSPLDIERKRAAHALKTAASLFIAGTVSSSSSVSAKVFIDVDSYGDKELKIATVNKLKQKLRDAILRDISIAPELYQLAINDALGFDAQTQEGGPDASIKFEMKLDGNVGLERALQITLDVKKELQRTNTVSLSDVVSFAGAEALETAGCKRITVQVGRDDAKAANEKATPIQWGAGKSLCI